MTTNASRAFGFMIVMSFFVGCTSTSSTAVVESTPAPTPAQEKRESVDVTSENAIEETSGCELGWNREARLQALNLAVEKSDLETQNVKDGFVNTSQRNRLAILSAGMIPDEVPFISLDRSCWSEFYRAHQSLRDGNESRAKKAAEGWKVCLASNFPDRSKVAKNLYPCFGVAPEMNADDSNLESED